MVYRGHIRNGKVELEDAPRLPEGAAVELNIVSTSKSDADRQGGPADADEDLLPIEEKLDRVWADVPESEWNNLPPDLVDNLDHYIYGTPKE